MRGRVVWLFVHGRKVDLEYSRSVHVGRGDLRVRLKDDVIRIVHGGRRKRCICILCRPAPDLMKVVVHIVRTFGGRRHDRFGCDIAIL